MKNKNNPDETGGEVGQKEEGDGVIDNNHFLLNM